MVRVHSNDIDGMLVQDPAVRMVQVTEAALGRFAEELQDEFDNGGVVVEQTEQINKAAHNRLYKCEQLLDSCQVDALDNTLRKQQRFKSYFVK